jgi:hypothetical protein
MDPALYASFFPGFSGKQCVVYKCVVENSMEDFDAWLKSAIETYGHSAFNFVGAASSSVQYASPALQSAGLRSLERGDCKFGCVRCSKDFHWRTVIIFSGIAKPGVPSFAH